MLSRECSAKVTNLYWISPTLQKQIAWRVICDWPDIWSFRQRSRTYAVVVRMNFVQPTARKCGGVPRKNHNQTNLPFPVAAFSEMALNISAVRDTKWLTLEVCRQFQRGNCSRGDEECKFAHPPKSCQVENGRVIACFDSLKVGSGANMYKSCFIEYVVDVSVGWCRMLLATPTNKSQIMSTPCLIPHHVSLELVTKLKRCQIYQKKKNGSRLVYSRSIPCVLSCPEWHQATLICSDTFTVAPQYSFAAGLCWVIVFVAWL